MVIVIIDAFKQHVLKGIFAALTPYFFYFMLRDFEHPRRHVIITAVITGILVGWLLG